MDTGKTATPLQCLLRNIFCMIWPIEIIVSFISPTRRIGDFVARTKLVLQESSIKSKKSAIRIALTLGMSYLITLGIKWLIL